MADDPLTFDEAKRLVAAELSPDAIPANWFVHTLPLLFEGSVAEFRSYVEQETVHHTWESKAAAKWLPDALQQLKDDRGFPFLFTLSLSEVRFGEVEVPKLTQKGKLTNRKFLRYGSQGPFPIAVIGFRGNQVREGLSKFRMSFWADPDRRELAATEYKSLRSQLSEVIWTEDAESLIAGQGITRRSEVMQRITSAPVLAGIAVLVTDPGFFLMRNGLRDEVRNLEKWPEALRAFNKDREKSDPRREAQSEGAKWDKESEQRLFQAVANKYPRLKGENKQETNK